MHLVSIPTEAERAISSISNQINGGETFSRVKRARILVS